MRCGSARSKSSPIARASGPARAGLHTQGRTQSIYVVGARSVPSLELSWGRAKRPACSQADAMQLHLDEIAIRCQPRSIMQSCSSIKLAGMAPQNSQGAEQHHAYAAAAARALTQWPGKTLASRSADRLSNGLQTFYDTALDYCCYASNTLIDQPWKIMSIARRDGVTTGYSM